MEYYNNKIQLHKEVINDVFNNFNSTTKLLVFGLGYDSKMWYNGNNKNTFFVENKDEYIKLNEKDIPKNNIIKYNYNNITVVKSLTMTDEQIKNYIIPEELLNNGPFDIIIIDGPEGYDVNKPGRLLPCYWSSFLSKPGTIIYVDDANRKLENYCINKFFSDKEKIMFKNRDGCCKITY